MAKYRIDSISELARQLPFAPVEARQKQLAAAEDLLHTVERERAYPLDYVVFRITGYHRKAGDAETQLTGIALQHDLGLLIEQVSITLDLNASDSAEPVLSIDDVCEKFNVTSKTIQRWRKKGLPSRRFTFPDGKSRVGFLLSSVERFLQRSEDAVEQASRFSQVDNAERDEIVRRARRLATQCECCVGEITRRVGRKLNRSPLTILHTLKKFDAEHPEQAVFPEAREGMNPLERTRVVKLFRRGSTIDRIARRVGRSRAGVYRAIIENRLERLNKRKIKFIDDPLYHEEDAEELLLSIQNAGELSERSESAEQKRVPSGLPPYLQELYRTPLLTPQQERALFLLYNFRKFQFVQARRKADPAFIRHRDLNLMEQRLKQANAVRNHIVQANLRLVVSIAKKHLRGNLSLMELVSEGNITLMRAVEGFDVHRGNKFSTYATLALMKGFARSVPAMQQAAKRAATRDALLPEVADERSEAIDAELSRRDQVNTLLGTLDRDERRVLEAQFGLRETEPASIDEVSRRLHISSESVRRIQRRAMNKLRRHAQSTDVGVAASAS